MSYYNAFCALLIIYFIRVIADKGRGSYARSPRRKNVKKDMSTDEVLRFFIARHNLPSGDPDFSPISTRRKNTEAGNFRSIDLSYWSVAAENVTGRSFPSFRGSIS